MLRIFSFENKIKCYIWLIYISYKNVVYNLVLNMLIEFTHWLCYILIF